MAIESLRKKSVKSVFESFAVTTVLGEVAIEAGHVAGWWRCFPLSKVWRDSMLFETMICTRDVWLHILGKKILRSNNSVDMDNTVTDNNQGVA